MSSLERHLQRRDAAPLFITGAGVSVASGLPTYRGTDPDAVWANHHTDTGTLDYFHRQPVKKWQMELGFFDKIRAAQPNAAHHALVELERRVPLTRTITQNVDGLHSVAGLTDCIEIHGSARKIRCTSRHCKYGAPRGFLEWDDAYLQPFRESPSRKTLPRCPHCRKFLRPHVLWFDEVYTGHHDYRFQEAMNWMVDATVMVFVGTSLAVNITAMAHRAGREHGIPMFLVDPFMREAPEDDITLIQAKAEEWLPQLTASLASA